MLPGPTLAALLIWAQVALGQYTMTSRWGAAVAVLPNPPAIVIQGGKTDASAAYSYTSAPNTADTVLLSLIKPFDASSPPYTLLEPSTDGPAVAWHCLTPLSVKDGVWTLLSFGGDGGWAGQVNDKSSAWLVQIDPQTGKTDYTPQPAGWGSQPSRRVRHSCAASPTGGKVYITGGQATDGSAIYDQVFLFDSSTQSFSSLPNLPAKLYHHSSVLLSNGTLVVFGGAFAKSDSNTDMQQLDKVFVLDTISADATWSTLKTSGKKPPPRRGSSAVLVSDNNIFVFGGTDKGGGNVMNDGWVFSPALMTWTQVFDGGKVGKKRAPGDVEGRYDHVAAAAGGDQVVVVGGYGKNGPVSPEMVLVSASLASNGNVQTTFTPSVIAAAAVVGGAGAGAVPGVDGTGAMAADGDTNNLDGDGVPGNVASPAGPSSPNGTRPPNSGGGGEGGKTGKTDSSTGDTAAPPQGTQSGGALAAHTNNTAKIIGLSVGIIGGLLLLALFILVFLLLRRRRRRGPQFSEKQDGGQHLIGSEEPATTARLQRKPTIGERLRGGAAGLARALSTKDSGGRYERMRKNRGPTIFPVPRTKSGEAGYGTALPTSPPGNIMYASTADLMMCPGYSRSASAATSMRSDASGEYSVQVAYDLPNDDSVGRSTLTQGWLASDEASANGDSRLSNSAFSPSRPLTPRSAGVGAATLGAALARSASQNKSLPPSPSSGTPVSGPDFSRPLPQLPAVISPGGSVIKPRISPVARGSPSRAALGRKASARSRRSSKASMLNPFDDGDVAGGMGSASSSRRESARTSWRASDESGDIGVVGRRGADDDPFTDAAGVGPMTTKFSSTGARLAGLSGEFGVAFAAAHSRSTSTGMSSAASHRTFGMGDFGAELDLSLTDYTPSKPPSRPESPVHSACLDEAARAASPPLSPTSPTAPAAPPALDQLEPLLRDAAVSRLRPASWASAGSGSDTTAEPASIERAMRAVSPKRTKSRPVQLVISPTSPLKFTGEEWTTSPLASPSLASPTLFHTPTAPTPRAEVASASAPTSSNLDTPAAAPEDILPHAPVTPAKTAPSTPGTTPRGTPRRQHRSLKSTSSLGSIQAPPVSVGASVRDKVNYFEARAESGTAGATDGASIQSSTPGRTVRKQTSFDPA